jgi:histidine triad (HIT) family protein
MIIVPNLTEHISQIPHLTDEHCLFCKIVAKKIPAKIIYEDDNILAFNDINPIAPVHFLIIPKTHIESLNHLDHTQLPLITQMISLAPRLAAEQGCRDGRNGGFRLLTNSGIDGGQEIFHLHFHVIGGARPWTNNK